MDDTVKNPSDMLGLTDEEVSERIKKGLVNTGTNIKTKSVSTIIKENVITLFNVINILIAVGLILVGSYKNITFMGVVLWNIFIGSFQAIRAKKIIDQLSVISAPAARVIRNGSEISINLEDIVIDDICVLENGNQICADGIIVKGQCQVNESLLTGESDLITKAIGDEVLSGSFIASGKVYAKVIHIGDDNYANSITKKAKYTKKINSEIFNSSKKLVAIISYFIAPIFAAMFFKQLIIEKTSVQRAVIATSASVISMIPSGLMLLISIVMALSVIKLSKYKALLQNMYCTETLARVDVLCLDKTGTITEGKMKVDQVIAVNESHCGERLMDELSVFSRGLEDSNPTYNALREYCQERISWENEDEAIITIKLATEQENKVYKCIGAVPFSSEKKWSMIAIEDVGTRVFGAYEFIFEKKDKAIIDKIKLYQEQGKRVLAFGGSSRIYDNDSIPEDIELIGLVVISDIVRSEASETLQFFRQQGVNIKIISGDNVTTVANVAKEAGVEAYHKAIDVSGLSDEQLKKEVESHTIFGRVLPNQKLIIVQELKRLGHTVAMTGDGTNDVLALKEADCSIAMQQGSDAARNVSDIILMDSNFSSLPKIFNEGRKNINNLQRSSALFLMKTTYAIILAICFLFIPYEYPFEPIQITLVSSLTIGIPSFILALEGNYNIVKGHFLKNVLNVAVPAGIIISISIIIGECYGEILGYDNIQKSTIVLYSIGASSLMELIRVCRPLNRLRFILVITMCLCFIGGAFLFENLFSVTDMPRTETGMFILVLIISIFIIRHIFTKLKWIEK